ncbi:MAG: 50S ribosomal protein L3 [Candidatus Gracilibacteria bacterium]|jgi:large subunit ribosomal protein L3|nr:50S ribosomal protein L3 [Candidatus Gracilibacteria bacterium]
MSGIIGKKLGMGQVPQETGEMTPVTYVLCEPNQIVQVKNADKDNTNAVVLGANAVKKPTKTKKFKTLRQFNLPEKELKVGDQWTLADLGEISEVTVVGVSKGRGFQGGVKRHNFGTARKTHGTKEARHGSTGACTAPGRTKKGLKMAGHMGVDQVTIHNRKVVKIDTENNVIAIKGPVPGSINSQVILKTK